MARRCLELSVGCLARLMASSSAQLALVNARGVSALVRLVSGDGDVRLHSDALRREVARALMALAASKLHRPSLYAEGAVECLAELITEDLVGGKNELTLRYTAAALGHLAALPDAQVRAARAAARPERGGPRRRPPLALPRPPAPPPSRAISVHLHGAQMALSSAGAIPHLVRLARVHDPETQRHAARALGNLAANAACQKEIGQCGGLRPLIKCGYARSPELQQLVARAMVNLALEPELNRRIVDEGGAQLLLNLARSKHAEVAHWARVARGNVEAASALGGLVRYCPQDSPVEPVDMMTMSSLVSLLRSNEEVQLSVKRLTACAIANLLVSAHNQRLLLECNGVKPLVGLAMEAPEAELASQCMRALANLAVSAEYRPNLLQAPTPPRSRPISPWSPMRRPPLISRRTPPQAKVLPLLVKTLRDTQLQTDGAHTYAVLCHAARGIGNLCDGGEIAAAMQLKARSLPSSHGHASPDHPRPRHKRGAERGPERAPRARRRSRHPISAPISAARRRPTRARSPCCCRCSPRSSRRPRTSTAPASATSSRRPSTSCCARRCARWPSWRSCGTTSCRWSTARRSTSSSS